jgi:hypothetical protein
MALGGIKAGEMFAIIQAIQMGRARLNKYPWDCCGIETVAF